MDGQLSFYAFLECKKKKREDIVKDFNGHGILRYIGLGRRKAQYELAHLVFMSLSCRRYERRKCVDDHLANEKGTQNCSQKMNSAFVRGQGLQPGSSVDLIFRVASAPMSFPIVEFSRSTDRQYSKGFHNISTHIMSKILNML